MKFIAIIPARFASTRFPGKPLAILGGKTVIQRVYEQVTMALNPHPSTLTPPPSSLNTHLSPLNNVFVATDDERIFNAVEAFGGQAVMTRADHQSGTDRIEEAAEKIGTDADVIINVQGDEPFIRPSQIETLMHLFDDPETQIGTIGKPFDTMEAVQNPNSPKIVCDLRGYALYFSRSVIPFVRQPSTFGLQPSDYLKHLGLYAYRRDVLGQITKLPQSQLEKAESLEQLRWLQNGYRIKVGLTDEETVGIDTPEDLQRAETFLQTIG